MKRNKTIVIGCGRLGSSIATNLSLSGNNVIVIDSNKDSFRRLSDGFNGYTIVGDATDIIFLNEQFLDEASKAIIVTNDDNVNLYVAHLCTYIFNVPKVYIRLADNSKSVLLNDDRIKAIYPFILSINEMDKLFKGDEE
ncbi:MAG: NAD-binding protein [Anaeroplasmataceae bacterium]